MNGIEPHQLVDHLFRDRAGQMVAWVTRVFGPAHLELAEEVVQDALVKAHRAERRLLARRPGDSGA